MSMCRQLVPLMILTAFLPLAVGCAAQSSGPVVATNASTTAAESGGSLAGVVTESGSGLPLSMAQIVVTAMGAKKGQLGTTDADGKYRIAGLGEGVHAVKLSYAGITYTRAFVIREADAVKLDIAVDAGNGQPAVVSNTATGVAHAAFGSRGFGTIDGVILDKESRTPIKGAVVAVRIEPDGEWQLTVSRDNGKYQIVGLPAGKYLVSMSYTHVDYALVEYRRSGVGVSGGDVVTVDFDIRI